MGGGQSLMEAAAGWRTVAIGKGGQRRRQPHAPGGGGGAESVGDSVWVRVYVVILQKKNIPLCLMFTALPLKAEFYLLYVVFL